MLTFEGVLWLLLGGLLGVFTTWMLRRAVRYVQGGPPDGIWLRVGVGYILRLGIVSGFLIWAALRGIGSLLWAFVGLVASRWIMVAFVVRWSHGLRPNHPTTERLSDQREVTHG